MTEFKGDKRTKEYKAWKKKFEAEQDNKSKGLGDTISKITEVTGIKTLVKWVAGDDCGCDERQEKLNKLFSYRKINCINENQYNYLKEFYSTPRPSKIKRNDIQHLVDIHNKVFGTKYNRNTSCSSCVNTCYNNLSRLLKEAY